LATPYSPPLEIIASASDANKKETEHSQFSSEPGDLGVFLSIEHGNLNSQSIKGERRPNRVKMKESAQ
jgi:hypothetical protein